MAELSPRDIAFLKELRFDAALGLVAYDEFEEVAAKWVDISEQLDRGLDQDEFDRLLEERGRLQFLAILRLDSFFSNAARASLLLYPARKKYEERAEQLRALLWEPSEFSTGHPVEARALRNLWAHADERLEDALDAIASTEPYPIIYNFRFVDGDEENRRVDLYERAKRGDGVPPILAVGKHPAERRKQVLRQIDVREHKCHYLGTEYDLQSMREAVEDLHRRAANALEQAGVD